MLRPTVPLIALALLLAAAPAASAGITGFKTPSRNIFCAYMVFGSERSLRCDISKTDNRPPSKPASCEFDWGYSFGLTPSGKGRRLCVSDTPMDPKFPVLGYGRTWKRGPFTCRSRETGVRCTNTRGHGFELSRSRQRVF